MSQSATSAPAGAPFADLAFLSALEAAAPSPPARNYMEGLNWMGVASLTGCPATVAPVGRTPVGAQHAVPDAGTDRPKRA